MQLLVVVWKLRIDRQDQCAMHLFLDFFCHTFVAIIDLVCSSSETYAYENSNICDTTFERLAEEKKHLDSIWKHMADNNCWLQ